MAHVFPNLFGQDEHKLPRPVRRPPIQQGADVHTTTFGLPDTYERLS